jgi:hypothetical protein
MVKWLRIIFVFLMFDVGIGPGLAYGMQLQGRGAVRYLGLFKVYDAALYTPHPVPKEKILDATTSRCLKIDYAVALTAEDLVLGAETVLSRQNSPERVSQVRVEIDRLHSSYRDVGKGDSYSLCYEAASRNTTLLLNGQERVTITSADFAEIYFGIWLGPLAPIDGRLRDRLLTRME